MGGGSDLPAHYLKNGGSVLSASICQYVYIAVNKRFDESIRISYSKTEQVNFVSEIEHKLVRAALDKLKIQGGIEITSIADIPSQGTGLGSSSSFTVGLLHALHAYRGESISREELAAEACEVEINICGEPIGKQDQYGCALGGVNVIDFRRDDGVTITPVNIESSFQDTFQKSLLLFYTGLTRSASTILRNQMQEMTTNNKKSQVVTQMADMTMDFSKAIISCDILSIGKMLNEAWILKKYTSQEITNEVVDGMYEKALEAGAWGGKLLGAGGGGFLLICAPEYTHAKIKNALKKYRCMPFEIDRTGTTILYNSSKI